MKKKLTLLVLVILIALVTATPALARRGQQSFTIGGYITAIDRDKKTISVETVNDRLVTVQVTVQVTPSTIFLKWTEDGRVPTTFADIKVDDSTNISTNIKYTVDDGVNVASQVTVDVPLHCNP